MFGLSVNLLVTLLRLAVLGLGAWMIIEGHFTTGGLVASIPMGQAGAIEVPIPTPRAPTLFARVGNWMALLAIVLLFGLAIAIRRRAR